MLEARNLTKRFRVTTVFDKVNFAARPREITGYLGPNGSGKSTTVKMFAGALHPSVGQILYKIGPDARLAASSGQRASRIEAGNDLVFRAEGNSPEQRQIILSQTRKNSGRIHFGLLLPLRTSTGSSGTYPSRVGALQSTSFEVGGPDD